MKIYLFYEENIYNFMLPKQISGSYSFDADKNETSKLINIEAREGKWVIYSVDGVNLIYDRRYVKDLPLESGNFYIVNRNNKSYLIYACDISLNHFYPYTYDNNLSMTIGGQNANIIYPCPYLNQNVIKIYKNEKYFLLEQTQIGSVYINNKMIKNNQYILQTGDTITIYGLEILFLKNILFMNNPNNSLKMTSDFGLTLHQIPFEEENKNIVIQDKDLYDKKDYFSKSPRIRRTIETKKIKLSPPPSNNENEEMPMILTIGPMATMGIMSLVTVINLFMKLGSGETTMAQSWTQMVIAGAMLGSMILWPLITNFYNKKMKKRKREELVQKYDAYLAEKEKEIEEEAHLQKDILTENLITINDCLEIINKKGIGFWDKRVDQNDFLVARLGMGSQLLDIEIEYPDQEFTIEEDELRKRSDAMIERHRYINNVPVSYSFYENRITAIMGTEKKISFAFMNNILLQLLTFYSYEDLKLVIFTSETNKNNWQYVKYLNHNFTNQRNFRFFASNIDSAKVVCEYLDNVLNNRISMNKEEPDKPHYMVIIDDYDLVKRFDFMKNLTELSEESNVGFSLIILEEKLNKLPSKCNNFISLSTNNSAILKNSYEKQEQIPFKDEINYNLNMMNLTKIMSNIPIEFEEGFKNMPDSISFLEMLEVGKVEQLNVLNRWNTNDATMSLRAEIGVDEQGDLMYLDLHEKNHGPHGLIAGTTGSGKSEFIITYILSMCINYSPDDVAFILIDYKGGGLALAFENKTTGVSLPHLAGTITNLDKAEMDRTLVSIDSEIKRRQEMFNVTRDKLGESTIDIYKYQRFYKEGKVTEPIPHLFIICDEFAELKAQQPDFMDNLISVARIGRSLGVHLILATQKPSGVVNDQIWSNTRFRVCLKVQDEADSKEMLKRPEAAHIKQAGRYYLQVGYDEYFALGQSGWCGAKYYPSDKIVKQVDKSINFINDFGQPIKSIQASGESKGPAQGEQLGATMKLIIDVANKVGKKTRRLWLSNISENITVDNLQTKYSIVPQPYHPTAILGEYDAPEKQEQGKVLYDYLEDGNTALYGNDGSERELLLSTMIYSTAKNHTAEEVNFYFIDYGSESLRRFQTLPQVGGMVFQGEDEKYKNLLKLLRNELSSRKRRFTEYGGEYKNFIKNSEEKLPLIIVIINNYDSIYEANPSAYEEFPDLVRDSERYGIVFIITGNAINSIQGKISQNLSNIYTYKLKDSSDYSSVFGSRTKTVPRDIFGRGLLNNDGIHEFQTAKIIDENNLNDFLQQFINNQKQINKTRAKRIPTLPNIVRYDDIESAVTNLNNVPVGISKNELEIVTVDYLNNIGNIITSNKLINTINFSKSLLKVFQNITNTTVMIFDSTKSLNLTKEEYPNYYIDNLGTTTDKIIEYIQKLIDSKSSQKGIIFIYNLNKYLSKLDDNSKFENLLKTLKKYENITIIVADDYSKIKSYEFEPWFRGVFNVNDGIWIGRGLTDQNLLHLSNISKEMMENIKSDMGYMVSENLATLCKFIDFVSQEDGEDDIHE